MGLGYLDLDNKTASVLQLNLSKRLRNSLKIPMKMKEIMMELEHFGGFFFSFVTDDDLRAATNGRNAIKIRNKSGNLFRNERPRSR